MPRIAKTLTGPEVKRLLKGGDGEFAVGGVSGLRLVVKEGRRPSWVLRLTVDGVRRRFTIGPADVLGIKEAREEALERISTLRREGLPKDSKNVVDDAPTMVDLLREWLQEQVDRKRWKNSEDRGRDHLRSLEKHVFPHVERLDVAKASAHDVARILRPLWCFPLKTFFATTPTTGE